MPEIVFVPDPNITEEEVAEWRKRRGYPPNAEIMRRGESANVVKHSKRTVDRWEAKGLFPRSVRLPGGGRGDFIDDVARWAIALARRHDAAA